MLKCLKCNAPLGLKDKSFVCANNHCYDISKRGYVNLSLNQKKDSGDDKDMVKARTHFLNQDYYKPLCDEVIKVIKSLKAQTLLDCGCGEGYYSNQIKKACDCNMIAIDLSKSAIDHACRAKSGVQYVVASLANLPLLDNSMDVLLSMFAPIYEDEFARVLKDGGYFIKVCPNQEHLMGLKQAIYDDVYVNEVSHVMNNFKLVREYEVSYDIEIDNQESIMALFQMTPYYYKTSKEGVNRVKKLNHLKTKVGFMIQIYQ